MRMKTKASKPQFNRNSSSVGSQAFLTQPAVGNKRSKLKWPPSLTFPSATSRGTYTVILPGCFLNIEYSVKNRRQRPRLIATEVKRAERIIIEI